MKGTENVKHRAWTPSRNALHLAAAFEFAQHVFFKANHRELGYWDYLWDADVIKVLLIYAEAFEPLVPIAAANHRFRFDPAAMLRLRIVNRVQKNPVP